MRPYIITLFLSSMSLILTGFLILYPNEALSASLRGLSMWAEIVFPSLLPFFIVAELLIAFGVVKFLGVLFEPVMRPLFNVPGSGSFAWIMGMASGYPTGAKIAARLRQDKQLSRLEAERLVSFTNNSSPLFIFGAIAIGFFHDEKLGILLAACHYGSNMIVGIIMRFHGFRKEQAQQLKQEKKRPSLRHALKQMHETRIKDKRPFGEILGDAVLQSIRTLVMVGGFIVLFSVLIRLLHIMEISLLVAGIIKILFHTLTIPGELALPFFSGLFEITLGTSLIAQTENVTIFNQLIIVSFILGFNGFSIQAQVASILAQTDIRFTPYFVARFIHGILASLFTIVLYKPLYLNNTVPTAIFPRLQETTNQVASGYFDSLAEFGILFTLTLLCVASLLLIYERKRDGF